MPVSSSLSSVHPVNFGWPIGCTGLQFRPRHADLSRGSGASRYPGRKSSYGRSHRVVGPAAKRPAGPGDLKAFVGQFLDLLETIASQDQDAMAREFCEQVGQFRARITAAADAGEVTRTGAAFIEAGRQYFAARRAIYAEREVGLRGMIQVLSDGLTTVATEAGSFTAQITGARIGSAAWRRWMTSACSSSAEPGSGRDQTGRRGETAERPRDARPPRPARRGARKLSPPDAGRRDDRSADQSRQPRAASTPRSISGSAAIEKPPGPSCWS